MKSAVVEGMMGVLMASSGNGNQNSNHPVQLVLDGRVIAEVTYNQFSNMARQGLIPKFT